MNIGARNAKSYKFDKDALQSDASGDVPDMVVKDVTRQINDALQWYEDRGSIGDNAPKSELESLRAIINTDAHVGEDAVLTAANILSGQMHPTARDICGAPAKQLIYNVCGKRAHTYEETDK